MTPAPGDGPPAVVAVVGPTASGKSDLAVALALALDGEVVNADALQLYRGMDVGTAKLTPHERRGVPHHLLDVLDVREEASVAAYQRQAREVVAGIHARGRRAVVVGGSGLYVRALLDRLEIPPTDAQVRARIEADLDREGAAALHARLARLDPAAAAAILPGNGRRVVRALEVVELTGRPFSATLPQQEYHLPAVQIGLAVPRPQLDARIAGRVQRMWEQGLVQEVRDLAGRGLREGRTARRALGYAQVLEALDATGTGGAGDGGGDPGGLDAALAAAREATVLATRRFARRQESWFRRDNRIHWLPFDAPDLPARALAAGSEVG
jgi:tRNA dimethylallyltransferase